jgi:pimeloyl-ACP methyl ester carboxylesterase
LKERTEKRDKAMSLSGYRAQRRAIHRWGLQQPADLSVIQQPTLVANGDQDRMVPTKNTFDLDRRRRNNELVRLRRRRSQVRMLSDMRLDQRRQGVR